MIPVLLMTAGIYGANDVMGGDMGLYGIAMSHDGNARYCWSYNDS